MATTAAVKKAPPGRPPADPAAPDPAGASPPPSSRRRQTPLTPMRREAAQRMRKLAAQVQESHPDLTVHDHLRDAARTLESGNEEASQRHLRAAMFSLSPQSLMKNGMHTDDLHLGARGVLHGVHRHLLLVKDIADVREKNQAQIRRDSYGDDSSSPPMPQPPAHDPNAGYGPGANAQRPTARQPGGDRALNAPARTNSGGSDPATADPVGAQPRGSKQFTRNGAGAVTELAYGWGDLLNVIGLAAGDDCYRCSTPNAPDARHCKRCGFAMEPRQPYDRFAAEDVTCPFCGLGDDADAVFCDQCGKRLPETVFAALAGGGKATELSAKTAMLEVTPAPYGKPGGPGLYGVAGNKHSDYFEQIVKALVEKRGMDKGRASAIAWGVLRKWAHGGGGVHPEVAAAASKALAGEAAASAKAHAHAVSWDDVASVVEMSAVLEFFNPAQPRVPPGQLGGGQFGAAGAAQPAQGQQAKGKQSPPPKLTAHQLHVAHVAHLNGVSTAKASLMVTAQDDKAKAAGLIKQRDALVKALASAGGKVSTGQAGAKTSTTATTKTTAPATTASTSTTAPATATAKAATAKAPAAPAKAGSAAAMKAQIASLDTQITALQAAAATATAQASKMK